jgi:predicted nuclease of predicted toxin-antitoxin system
VGDKVRLLVDENIPRMTVLYLRQNGHDVVDIRGTEKEGIPDSEVWALAQRENRLLIATDKWFSNSWDLPHPGVLIVLLKHPNRQKIHDRVVLALSNLQPSEWSQMIVTMRDTVRTVRKLR